MMIIEKIRALKIDDLLFNGTDLYQVAVLENINESQQDIVPTVYVTALSYDFPNFGMTIPYLLSSPTMEVVPMPTPGSIWQHHKGKRYIVRDIMNRRRERARHKFDDHPLTVSFIERTDESDSYWSRPLHDWYRSFTFLDDGYLG